MKCTYVLLIMILPFFNHAQIPSSPRSLAAIERCETKLDTAMQQNGLELGNKIFIRIFKNANELEVWIENGDTFELYKTYEICDFSGGLGPKKRQGDRKSPEGFYFVTPNQLNPWSSFHLSFNIGYPNAYDRAHGYTGSALMVHGNCVSIGCYAMTDPVIEEIWTIIAEAFENGQDFFRIHIFPFRMEDEALADYTGNKHYDFWCNLKKGYDFFEEHGNPPNVTVRNRRYVFN